MIKIDHNKDTRFCIRCGILESLVKKEGSDGCKTRRDGYYLRHSYTTNREMDKLVKESGLKL